MLKIQNDEGETLFEVKDDATRPKKVCPKCEQVGEDKPGEHPCPECGRNLLHEEDLEEEEGDEN
jgi:rRNA maturation endonuclease Nob1